MKSKINGLKELMACVMLTLCVQPKIALADIPPPPKPLHRVGFEIFKKETEKKAQPTVVAADEKAVKEEKTLKELLKKIIGGGLFADEGWKFPQQITAEERKTIGDKIASVKDDLQVRFDAEYDKLNQAGKLKKIGLFRGGYKYRYDRAKREIAEENALTVVKSVLEQDESLRKRCEGVPIEWLASAMKCPDPSIDDESIKNAFRSWAMQRMPNGLNGVERRIVFDWQFHVCENSGRPWLKVFETIGSRGRDQEVRRPRRFTDDFEDRLPAEADVKGFEDISERLSAAEYVVKWHEKAVRCGYEAKSYESLLVKKAKESPEGFSRGGNIGFSYDSEIISRGMFAKTSGPLSTVKVSVNGAVDANDMEMVADYCRNLQKSKDWLTELDDLSLNDCDGNLLTTVCQALSGFRVGGKVSVSCKKTQGASETKRDVQLEISDLSKLVAKWISFRNFRPTGRIRSGVDSQLRTIHMENCVLGDSFVLDADTELDELGFWECEFSGPVQFGMTQKVKRIFFRGALSPVDLSFVGRIKSLTSLSVPGCRVLNADALIGCADLNSLSIDRAAEGVDWVKIVESCPNVKYLDVANQSGRTVCPGKFGDGKDFTPDELLLFKRIMRKRSHGAHDIDEQLKDAVRDNDVEEAKRLLREGASVQKAWKSVGSQCSTEMTNLLMDNGADAKAEIKGTWVGRVFTVCCDPREDRNRIGTLKLLLEHGADPNEITPPGKKVPLDALMSYRGVNEVHLEMAKLLLGYGANPKLMVDGLYNLCRGCDPVGSNRVEILRVLLDKGCKQEAIDQAWLGIADEGYKSADALQMAELLFAHGAITSKAQSRFHNLGWNPGLLKLYLSKGGDPNVKDPNGELVLHGFFDNSSMMEEWRKDGLESVLQTLKDRGAKISEALKGVRMSELIGDPSDEIDDRARSLAKVWVSYGADADCGTFGFETLLERSVGVHSYAREEDLAFVKFLVESGAEVKKKALVVKAYEDTFERKGVRRQNLVKLLIGLRVDVNEADSLGRTVLVEALAEKKVDIDFVGYLLDHGAILDVQDPSARNVILGHTSAEVIDSLFKRGLKIDDADFLALALKRSLNRYELMKIWLQHDADPMHRVENESAIECAVRTRATMKTIDLLVEKAKSVPPELSAVIRKRKTFLSTKGKSSFHVAYTGHGREMEVITLPDGTTSLSTWAFAKCGRLKTVVMPSTVVSIGEAAFEDCSNLETVVWSTGLVEICGGAFTGCNKLNVVELPNGLEVIGHLAFQGCEGLRQVTIPDTVDEIGDSAFISCGRLEKIVLPERLRALPERLFMDCESLSNVRIPAGCVSIGGAVFSRCKALEHVEFRDGLKTIGMGAFGDCSRLMSIALPRSVSRIGYGAFEGCASLRSVDLSSSCLQTIPGVAFRNCTSLESVVLPDGLEKIEERAFEGCVNLKSIKIPAGVKRISPDAFRGCKNLPPGTLPSKRSSRHWQKCFGNAVDVM